VKLIRQWWAGDLSFVHVPDEGDEAFRDLVRAWGAAKEDVKRAKQRLKSFLLVHGVRYEGKGDWNEAHKRCSLISPFHGSIHSWRSRNTGAPSRIAGRSACVWSRCCVRRCRGGGSIW
jgi:hypothetical protein